jgi:flagellar biosynthesis protein
MNDTVAGVDIREGVQPNSVQETLRKAVALEYERGVYDAPRIIASGKGAIAEQILTVAYAQGIKVREDADLIEILETLDVDSLIPLEAFATVAQILSYVYAANASFKQRQARNLHRE